jgi:GNAT superfamily N-acetyltransferase
MAVRAVAECTSAEVAAALTRCFEGYLVPMRMDARAFETRFRGEHLDPFASQLHTEGGETAALLLVARRGWTRRVAAMAVAPPFRGQGWGRRLMEEAIAQARREGDRTLLLEVIAQNAPALALYRSLGFEARRTLVGFRVAAGAPLEEAPGALRELDPADLARLAFAHGEAGLPWVLQPETLAAAASPARAYHLEGQAYALVADPAAPVLQLRALVVPLSARRQGWGLRMLHALRAAFPDRPWAVSAVVPEGLAPGLFARAGWEPQPVQQYEMALSLR